MTSSVGSIAVTVDVVGSRAAEEAKMPPPQPMSRNEYDCAGGEDKARHDRMKSWRRGFIRCRSRDGP